MVTRRTTLTMIIFTTLLVVLTSSIAVASTTTTLSAMTMQRGNQTAMMNKNMTSDNMTNSSANITK